MPNNLPFDLFNYFEGETSAWGIFEDRFGNLRRSFSVKIFGKCQDNTLILTETFVYNDGEESERTWTINRLDAFHYTGKAADVLGIAEGEITENSFCWNYHMQLPISGKTVTVAFSDKIYALDSQNLFNRAIVSKWGITIGSVSLFFKK